MHVKLNTLAIFLDIEGAFNNVDPDAKFSAFSSVNLVQNLVGTSS